jgi:hypothetical protein
MDEGMFFILHTTSWWYRAPEKSSTGEGCRVRGWKETGACGWHTTDGDAKLGKGCIYRTNRGVNKVINMDAITGVRDDAQLVGAGRPNHLD